MCACGAAVGNSGPPNSSPPVTLQHYRVKSCDWPRRVDVQVKRMQVILMKVTIINCIYGQKGTGANHSIELLFE